MATLLLPVSEQEAEADHPVAWGVGASIAIGIAASLAASAVWDLINDDVTTTTTTTTTTTDSEGNTTTTSTTTTETTESPAYIHIPQDIAPMPGPLYDMNEEIYFENLPDDRVAIEYRNMHHETDILNPSGDLARKFDLNRETTFAYTRPPGIFASNFELDLAFDDMSFTTTDVAGTDGFVLYVMEVVSPQLGRLFMSQVEVRPGANPKVTGDILASQFTLSPGSALIDGVNKSVRVQVPASVNRVDVLVRYRTIGEGHIVP